MNEDDTLMNDGGLDNVLHAMNSAPGRTRIKPPTQAPKPLTPDERAWLSASGLPATPGFYWVENIHTDRINMAWIDITGDINFVDHWGHVCTDIGVTKRWLEGHTVLAPAEPPKEEITPQQNETYGMF